MKTIGRNSPGTNVRFYIKAETGNHAKAGRGTIVCVWNLYHLTVDCKPNTYQCHSIVKNKMLHHDEPTKFTE